MITLKYFASLKDLVGVAEEKVALVAPRTVAELVEASPGRLAKLRDLIGQGKVLLAVNQVAATESTRIRDGDEVAFLPPFAGGNRIAVRIQEDDFSVEEEIARLKEGSTRIGGIVTFVGVARDFSKGKPVTVMTFEHYAGMAERCLMDIRERAIKRFGLFDMTIIHRTGELCPGENIVLILAGAEHRPEAFSACEWAIEELKAITPIWKRERTPDGDTWTD